MKLSTKILSVVPTLFLVGLGLISCEDTDSDDGSQVERSYELVATGQVTLYNNDGEVISGLSIGDALYGQDANYLKGSSMLYENNGDSTITDTNTGLMWEQYPIPDGLTWDEAVEYCENLEFAGYDDWRMPSLKELFSISDFGKGWPYIDTDYFALASGVVDKSEQFWSSNKYVGSTVEGGENAVFGVNHVTGHIKAYPSGNEMPEGGDDMLPPDGGPQGTTPNGEGDDTTFPSTGDTTDVSAMPPSGLPGDNTDNGTLPPSEDIGGDMSTSSPLTKHVRAVRGDVYGDNDFQDNGDATISDNATGMMWSQDDNGVALNWEDALAYAENSTLGGYSDWRLPNVKELQAIVCYNYAPGATDPDNEGPAIDPIFSCTPIVNEAGVDDYAYYWTSTSANFTSGDPYYYAWYVAFGRAVNADGEDYHGAGGVRFDTKYEGGELGEGGERYYNYIRLVRDLD